MTHNKRFRFEKERINNSFACRIFEGDEVLFEVNNWGALSQSNSKEVEDLCNLMNRLYDENTELRDDALYWASMSEARLKEIEKLKGIVAHYELLLMSLEKEAQRLTRIPKGF